MLSICADAAYTPLKTLLSAGFVLLLVYAAGWRQGFKVKTLHASAADQQPPMQNPCSNMATVKQIQYVKDLANKHNLTLNIDPADMTKMQASCWQHLPHMFYHFILCCAIVFVCFVDLRITLLSRLQATHWIDTTKAMFNLK